MQPSLRHEIPNASENCWSFPINVTIFDSVGDVENTLVVNVFKIKGTSMIRDGQRSKITWQNIKDAMKKVRKYEESKRWPWTG